MTGVGEASRPFFSLVVPTVGRSAEVREMLRSAVGSSVQDFELIIVDQNADDRLREVCAEYAARIPLQRMQVSFKGAARARNYGARFATGEVINFPDDDCELSTRLLEDAQRLFESNCYKVVIGMTVDRQGHASTASFRRDQRVLSEWSMWGRNVECTMFFRRNVFLASDGFDERFGVGSDFGSDEGAELLIRLLKKLAPGEVFYTDRLAFYHPQKGTGCSPDDLRRAFSYARGTGALFAKWPTASVTYHCARLLVRAAAAALICVGQRRRFYLERLRGFVDGYRDFVRRTRAGAER